MSNLYISFRANIAVMEYMKTKKAVEHLVTTAFFATWIMKFCLYHFAGSLLHMPLLWNPTKPFCGFDILNVVSTILYRHLIMQASALALVLALALVPATVPLLAQAHEYPTAQSLQFLYQYPS